MPILELSNRKVHYIEMNRGAAETIIMVHGLFSNLSVFYFNIAPRLAKYFHVLLYDLRSHGMSEWKDEGYSLYRMSQDLIELADALDIFRFNLLGYSYGGLISLTTAINNPERVKKVSLIDSPDPTKGGQMSEILSAYRKEFLDQYINDYINSNHVKPNKRQLDKSEKLYEYLLKNDSIRNEMAQDNDFLTKESFCNMRQQTLLLYAKESTCLETGKKLEKLIPGSILKTGYGDHNIPIQNPLWISFMVKFFIRNSGWNAYATFTGLIYDKLFFLYRRIPPLQKAYKKRSRIE